MRAEVQNFARDLLASLRYYQEQPGSLGISEIVLAGGGAQLPGFAAELSNLLGLTVRVADPLARLKPGKKAERAEIGPGFASAIGLGIDD
jgi:type IV pilus assembly protein PilM